MAADLDVIKVDLPQDIYDSHLESIGGISFTPREIDIIACILSGRSAKKIASFLSISPKTVKNHIHNVMSKLACRSQENIIDFMERSGKFKFLKSYYSALLVRIAFESELKKISKLISNKSLTCCIVYPDKQKEDLLFISLLKNYLLLAGIKVSFQTIEKFFNKNVACTKEFTNIDSIIFVMDESQLENQMKEISIFLENKVGKLDPVILLSLNKKSRFLPENFCGFSLINLSEQVNYYFLVFETLNKLLPSIDLYENISEFGLQCKMIGDPSYSPKREGKARCAPKENANFISHNALDKRQKAILCGGMFSIIFSIFALFYSYQTYNNKSKSANQVIQLPPAFSDLLAEKKSNKSVGWNLPRLDHIFVGRTELLDELDQKLNSKIKSSFSEPIMVNVCAGMAGVGKTQFVLQYIHRTKHPYTLRAWFASENLDQLKQQYIEFAKMLGYKEEEPSTKTALPYVKKWLSKNPGWLLVYDNANSYDEIKEFLPDSPGSVIITSRQQKWPSGFEAIHVDVMNQKESIALIQSLIRRKITEAEQESVKELVEALGCLPLALAQAGAYIHQNQITISEYLEFYKKHEQKLLSDSILPEGTNCLPVAINWDISLDALFKEIKPINQALLALDLLSVCAYLAPEKIPHNLLLTWLKKSHPELTSPELELTKLLGQLWKYSMIQREENGDITVHRLVQSAVRHRHKQGLIREKMEHSTLTFEWYSTLLESVHEEFSNKVNVLGNEFRQKKLLPHLQILLAHYEQLWPNKFGFNTAYIDSDIGRVFFLMGEFRSAKSHYEHALSVFERLYSKEHIEVAKILDQLGRAYRYLGEAKQAERAFERALKIKEQYYDKDHIEIAYTLEQLGRAYRYLGDPKKAKGVHEHALVIKKQHYGQDHLEIANVLDELGKDYRSLSHYKEAKKVHEEALRIKEQYYGKEHIEVAYTLSELGRSYRNVGDAKLAKALHERALSIKRQHYGDDHFEVAYTLNELGNDYRDLGNVKKAREYHERALRMREQYYGKDHMEVACTLDQLGNDYIDLKKFELAKKSLEQALKIKEQYYGKDHPETARSLTSLGYVYTLLNETTQGKICLENALKIKEIYYGLDNPEVAETLVELGRACKHLDKPKQAEAHLKRALKIREQYFGRNHSFTRKTNRVFS